MEQDFSIPPESKQNLTPPQVLADRLRILVGKKFKLTQKTRTDGSNIRKLIADTLTKYPLPPLSSKDLYKIIPPKGKGLPKIRREYLDTYMVTTGQVYNLQVWNRNPVAKSVQIEYISGEKLFSSDVRFVFVKIHSLSEEIRSIVI
jgi:hypothetical protein